MTGRNILAAGYCLYSYSTHIIITTGHSRVHHLVLCNNEFIFKNDIQPVYSKNAKKIYATGHSIDCNYRIKLAIQSLRTNKYLLRYTGCLVADFHNIIMNGGVFLYPLNDYTKEAKIRLLYEANPMAFIIKQLDGGAITEFKTDILHITPKQIHETVSIIFGTKEDIQLVRSYL